MAVPVSKAIAAVTAALMIATCLTMTKAATSASSSPASQALLASSHDGDNWLLPGKTYAGNRYTTLTDITTANVSHLKKAWITPIVDNGEEEASPIVLNGTLYVSTAHDNVIALNGANGALKWAFPYSPAYELQYAVNRGVGIADGKVFIATQDCRIVAIDQASGKQVWNASGCRDTSSSWYSMATYVYKHQVVLGTSGGDLGGSGLVSGFSTQDGHRMWEWHTIPQPGQPHHDSWPGDSWKHGGAAVWNGLSIDQDTDTVFVTPGNAGPNLTLVGRKGPDLYSNSVVALDISSGTPRVKWFYQILQNDTHDADPAMPPVLFTGKVAGHDRKLLAVADKAGDFLILDRVTGALLHRLAVSNQKNLFTTLPSPSGTYACPNHGGGVEWNGGSYDPASNLFLIPSTDECATWKTTTSGPVTYIPGQPFSAGPLPKRRVSTGLVTAVDVSTGHVKWREALPYSAQGGVLIAPGGLAFTSDLRGRVYAFNTANGKMLWHDDTGSAIVAPLSAYRAGGHEYIAVFAGEGGNQRTPNLPKSHGGRVVAYRIDAPAVTMNSTHGQPPIVAVAAGQKNESSATASVSVPYTAAQVATGKAVFAQQCSSCHGASLQGISAPALTGVSFGHAHLNVAQVQNIVTQQMPLGAPGSLKPAEYAAVIAYLLAYDCVKPSQNGKVPFPTSAPPALKLAIVPTATCPVK